jgi:membrane protein required for colicin V production
VSLYKRHLSPQAGSGARGRPGPTARVLVVQNGQRMNAFDIIVIVIVGYSLIRGVFRGLVKEVSSIVGVLGGFFAAYSLYGTVAGYLSGVIANASYRSILAFLVIFCAVVFLVNLLALVLKYLLKIVFLGWFDRLCGMGFGFLKGVLIVSVLFLALTTFLPKNTPLIKNSISGPYISMISEKLALVITSDMKREFTAKLGELKKDWKLLH